MNKEDKINEIVSFVKTYPDSTASQAIMRRFYLTRHKFETSQELGIQLKESLVKEKEDEINFCFYLVK